MLEQSELIPCDIRAGKGKSEHSPVSVRGKR